MLSLGSRSSSGAAARDDAEFEMVEIGEKGLTRTGTEISVFNAIMSGDDKLLGGQRKDSEVKMHFNNKIGKKKKKKKKKKKEEEEKKKGKEDERRRFPLTTSVAATDSQPNSQRFAPLPPNWTQLETEDGAVYFYSNETGETQWERPG